MQNQPKTNTILLSIIAILLVIILTIILIDNFKNTTPKEVISPLKKESPEETILKKTDKKLGEILINGEKIILPNQRCTLNRSNGGKMVYGIEVYFEDKSNPYLGYVSFGIQDDKKENILKAGIHTASGDAWDEYSNGLKRDNNYTFGYLKPEHMDIVFNKIDDINDIVYKFSAEGYINIKETVKKICPNIIQINGEWKRKGESGYVCNENYLEPQRIYFKCDEI